jgi:hypothetical protein
MKEDKAIPSQSLRRLRKRGRVRSHNPGMGPGRLAHRPSPRPAGPCRCDYSTSHGLPAPTARDT